MLVAEAFALKFRAAFQSSMRSGGVYAVRTRENHRTARILSSKPIYAGKLIYAGVGSTGAFDSRSTSVSSATVPATRQTRIMRTAIAAITHAPTAM